MTTGDRITHSDGRTGTVRACGVVVDERGSEEYAVVRWDERFTSLSGRRRFTERCLSKYLRPFGAPLTAQQEGK